MVGSPIIRGDITFVPEEGKTYYVTFLVDNGVAMEIAAYSSFGVVFSTKPPQTRKERFGNSQVLQVGAVCSGRVGGWEGGISWRVPGNTRRVGCTVVTS